MTHAYDSSYLDDAQHILGGMLDYATNTCGQNLTEFYNRFLSSGIAESFARASPKYMGLSGIELALLVAERTGEPLPLKDTFVDVGSPEFWTGWALAYISWYLNIDFQTLQQRDFSVALLWTRFSPLHEADLSKTVEWAQERMQEYVSRDNPLKRQRKRAALTQEELARLSGQSLRAIRAWEQGQRPLSSAAAGSVRCLCKALGCRMEDLL